MDMGVDPGHFLTTHFDIKSSDIIQICKYKNKQETEKKIIPQVEIWINCINKLKNFAGRM